MFFGAQRASVQKERKMWTHHDQKPLTEVPVPRMSPIKLSNALKYIQLQKIPLDKDPLQINTNITVDIVLIHLIYVHYILQSRQKNRKKYLSIKHRVDQSREGQRKNPAE